MYPRCYNVKQAGNSLPRLSRKRYPKGISTGINGENIMLRSNTIPAEENKGIGRYSQSKE